MEENYTTVGQKLRKCREACALSQRQVAEALNISRSTYTRYEIDDTEPSFDSLLKLSSIFNVEVTELLPQRDSAAPVLTLHDVQGVDSPIYQLSKDERGILAIYRSLTKDEKGEVADFMANISKKD